MRADGDILASFLVVGANHRSSSLAVRERLFVPDDGVAAFLDRLRRARIDQAVLLSTGDRVEVAVQAADAGGAQDDIVAAFADHAELAPAEVKGHLYALGGADAIRHLFAAAATLDSLIVGEAQVLDHLKAGHEIAREAGMIGAELDSVLQAVYRTAERARAETGIGEGPVSLSSSAIRVARDLHGAIFEPQGQANVAKLAGIDAQAFDLEVDVPVQPLHPYGYQRRIGKDALSRRSRLELCGGRCRRLNNRELRQRRRQ